LRGRTVIVDDVITDGASKRESVELLRREKAEPVAVLIALDRMERGGAGDNLSERSAVEEFERDYAIPVIPVATVADLLEFLTSHADPTLAAHADAVSAYRCATASEPVRPGALAAPLLLAALALAVACSARAADKPEVAPQIRTIFQCELNGKKITSDRLIPECVHKEQKELNPDGSLKRIHPPTPTADELAAKEEKDREAKLETGRQERCRPSRPKPDATLSGRGGASQGAREGARRAADRGQDLR
jgi:hypothetical protein